MNLVAHMVNAMSKVLRDCIPDITMPLLDDIPIKGCPVEEKDESVGPDTLVTARRCYRSWRVRNSPSPERNQISGS